MTEPPNSQDAQMRPASVEADLLGAILAFHQKTTTLLRQSTLDDEQLKVVAERIKAMLDEVTDQTKRGQQIKLTERLEAAYEEIKWLVEEAMRSRKERSGQ